MVILLLYLAVQRQAANKNTSLFDDKDIINSDCSAGENHHKHKLLLPDSNTEQWDDSRLQIFREQNVYRVFVNVKYIDLRKKQV